MKPGTKWPDKLQLKSTQCRIDFVDGCALSFDKYLALVDVSAVHLSVPIIISSSHYTTKNISWYHVGFLQTLKTIAGKLM